MTDDTLLGTIPTTSTYESLVGDGKKFRDNEALAKAKLESDNYIKTLEIKMDELRSDWLKSKDELATKAKLEDYIDQIDSSRLQTSGSNTPKAGDVLTRPNIDMDQIKSLFSSEFQKEKQLEKQQQNFERVQNKLKERYGEKSADVVKQHIDELGISVDRLNQMARSEPMVLIRALGLDQTTAQPGFQTPPRSTQRSDTFAPKGTQQHTWSYWQKLKADNPKLYHDPKTNIQMLNDMETLGEAFKDGDFSRYGD